MQITQQHSLYYSCYFGNLNTENCSEVNYSSGATRWPGVVLHVLQEKGIESPLILQISARPKMLARTDKGHTWAHIPPPPSLLSHIQVLPCPSAQPKMLARTDKGHTWAHIPPSVIKSYTSIALSICVTCTISDLVPLLTADSWATPPIKLRSDEPVPR